MFGRNQNDHPEFLMEEEIPGEDGMIEIRIRIPSDEEEPLEQRIPSHDDSPEQYARLYSSNTPPAATSEADLLTQPLPLPSSISPDSDLDSVDSSVSAIKSLFSKEQASLTPPLDIEEAKTTSENSSSSACSSSLPPGEFLFFANSSNNTSNPTSKETKAIDENPILNNFNKELSEIKQVLSFVQSSLKVNLKEISNSYLTLKPLKEAYQNLESNSGKDLTQAIEQQQKYVNNMRWAPYLPNVVLAFPLIPALWKFPLGILLCVLGNQVDKYQFGKYSYNLNKLEKIAELQTVLVNKKIHAECNIAGYNHLSKFHTLYPIQLPGLHLNSFRR